MNSQGDKYAEWQRKAQVQHDAKIKSIAMDENLGADEKE